MHSAQCVPAYAGLRTILVPTSQQVSESLKSAVDSANMADLLITGDNERAVVVSGAAGNMGDAVQPGFVVRITYDTGIALVWCEPGTTRLILSRAAVKVEADGNAMVAAWSEQLQSMEKSK